MRRVSGHAHRSVGVELRLARSRSSRTESGSRWPRGPSRREAEHRRADVGDEYFITMGPSGIGTANCGDRHHLAISGSAGISPSRCGTGRRGRAFASSATPESSSRGARRAGSSGSDPLGRTARPVCLTEAMDTCRPIDIGAAFDGLTFLPDRTPATDDTTDAPWADRLATRLQRCFVSGNSRAALTTNTTRREVDCNVIVTAVT